MTSIIIYANELENLDRTIDEIIDKTHEKTIGEIIICNDSGKQYHREDVKIINGDKIGRAKIFNNGIINSKHDIIVLLSSPTKLTVDWLQPILDKLENNRSALVTPEINILNTTLWSSEPNKWQKFGFRWDFELYNRPSDGDETPAISSYCIATRREWLINIGMFDDNMEYGNGEDIELSIRNWLLGGKTLVANSRISCGYNSISSTKNKARISAIWFNKNNDHDTGKTNNILNIKNKCVNGIEWYIETKLPELGRIHKLKNSAQGKNIAIIGPGASLDYAIINSINMYDIVIGIDYSANMIKCDYVMSESLEIISELMLTYDNNEFILPTYLIDRGKLVPTNGLVKNSYQFEMGQIGLQYNDVDPPFCNYGNTTLCALHFGLFLKPKSITIFGLDDKIIDGKSHTTKVKNHQDGKLWPDSDSTISSMMYFKTGLDHLVELATSSGVKVLRLTYA